MMLRDYRQSVGTLEKAARALRLAPGYLSQVERGLKWPGPFIIRKIQKWSNRQVTAQDIFDNLDMSLFAIKPIRTKGRRGGRGLTPDGDPPHGQKASTKKEGRRQK